MNELGPLCVGRLPSLVIPQRAVTQACLQGSSPTRPRTCGGAVRVIRRALSCEPGNTRLTVGIS